jgi:hypothetical protein
MVRPSILGWVTATSASHGLRTRILSSIDVEGTDIKSSIATAIQSVLESHYTKLESDLRHTSQTEELRRRVSAGQAKRKTKRR